MKVSGMKIRQQECGRARQQKQQDESIDGTPPYIE